MGFQWDINMDLMYCEDISILTVFQTKWSEKNSYSCLNIKYLKVNIINCRD